MPSRSDAEGPGRHARREAELYDEVLVGRVRRHAAALQDAPRGEARDRRRLEPASASTRRCRAASRPSRSTPDGSKFAAVSSLDGKGEVRVYDTNTGTKVVCEKVTGPAYAVAWHPDGKLIASAGFDGTVWLHDPATGKLVSSFVVLPKASATTIGARVNTNDARGRSRAGSLTRQNSRDLRHEALPIPARGRPRSSRCRALAAAQEKLPAGAKVTKLDVRPAKVELTGPFAYAQLARHRDARQRRDGRRDAHRDDRDARAAVDRDRRARPADRRRQRRHHGLARRAVGRRSPSTSTGLQGRHAGQLRHRRAAGAVARLGCNAGTCHGAGQGKNGFKLSLRGYDPIFDHRALTDDLEGRRFNRAAPEKSLMLLKPAGAVPHQGGVIDAAGRPELRTASAAGSPRA